MHYALIVSCTYPKIKNKTTKTRVKKRPQKNLDANLKKKNMLLSKLEE